MSPYRHAGPAPTWTLRDRRWSHRAITFLASATIAFVAASAVVSALASSEANAIGAHDVDALLSSAVPRLHEPLRISGDLVPGSVVKIESPCEYRFSIQKNGFRLPVRHSACVVPDGFRDAPSRTVSVVVEGELQSDGFIAAQLLVREGCRYGARDPIEADASGDGGR